MYSSSELESTLLLDRNKDRDAQVRRDVQQNERGIPLSGERDTWSRRRQDDTSDTARRYCKQKIICGTGQRLDDFNQQRERMDS